jgi:hypothetical protein
VAENRAALFRAPVLVEPARYEKPQEHFFARRFWLSRRVTKNRKNTFSRADWC